MCDPCDDKRDGKEEGDPVGCQDCGCLICFDCERGDDVLRPAYVTASGDLYCDRCGSRYDAEEEAEDYDDGDFYDPDEPRRESPSERTEYLSDC